MGTTHVARSTAISWSIPRAIEYTSNERYGPGGGHTSDGGGAAALASTSGQPTTLVSTAHATSTGARAAPTIAAPAEDADGDSSNSDDQALF